MDDRRLDQKGTCVVRRVQFMGNDDIPRGKHAVLFHADAVAWLKKAPDAWADLIVTSPPYNLSKEYEKWRRFDDYIKWQGGIIAKLSHVLKEGGSICYQVGNYVEHGCIEPLDIHLHEYFCEAGLTLRNRIVWHFGHGLHCKRRFSGRYEVILWYTKGEEYVFNLDDVRVPPKYPGKRSYKGPRKGHLSSNPLGKNPEDVWAIPNVKGNHVEKTIHPCQFPVGLVERLVLALTNRGDVILDPFCGVGSAGVAAVLHNRAFAGVDSSREYLNIARDRIKLAQAGKLRYRPHDNDLYDHRRSPLSWRPEE